MKAPAYYKTEYYVEIVPEKIWKRLMHLMYHIFAPVLCIDYFTLDPSLDSRHLRRLLIFFLLYPEPESPFV